MSKDYSPEILQALAICNRIPGAGHIAETAISQLWGDVGHLNNRAKFWKSVAIDASQQVVGKLGDETKAISSDHWEGKAREAYTSWISELDDQAKRIQDSIWTIGTMFSDAATAVEQMRADLRKMAMWLIGAVASAAAASKGGELGIAGAAICGWEFIQQLNDYRDAGNERFSQLAGSARDLRMLSKDLISYDDGKMPGPFPMPVQIPEFAPILPLDPAADWRNWGKADPKSRK